MVWVLGAGFSKAAGMPLATELLEPLVEQLYNDEELRGWLQSLSKILNWLDSSSDTPGLRINIEQVFHFGYFDSEARRLQQHVLPVGRGDGPGTPWNSAYSIDHWLRSMEEALVDVIWKREEGANLERLTGWAAAAQAGHAVVTFNYDTLAERALELAARPWNHGTQLDSDRRDGIPIFKMHGSVDWIVADRRQHYPQRDVIFEKVNENRHDNDSPTGHVEDDCCLWRCRSLDQRSQWLDGRDVQCSRPDTWLQTPGIAGLGAYKPLHRIPGLGEVWIKAMKAVYQADCLIVIGFQLSDFDALAQIQFASAVMDRTRSGRPLPVAVIDPAADDPEFRLRFERVFREVRFIPVTHEKFSEWDHLW